MHIGTGIVEGWRRLVGALVLVVSVAAVAAPPVAAQPLYPVPDPDPFYAAPPDVARYAPGDVIDSRPMPPLLEFPGTEVRMVKFRSTNSAGDPIAATSIVLKPSGFRANAPVLSYQHIINGLGTKCAVSRALYSSDPLLTIREAPALNVALQRGWMIALPDHLGPTSAYGAARLGGMITLDGVRAVHRTPGLDAGASPVALAGYSGGGMATAWAAALQPTYAPELRIVGAAAGGVPMNISKMARALGDAPHPAFGLAMAAAIGLEREYPERFPLSTQLNAKGIALRNQMANGCTNEILGNGVGRSVPELAASKALQTDPRAWAVGDENSLEFYAGVPAMPIYEWHSPIDGLIPIDSIDVTVRRYCGAGVRIQSETFTSPDHLTTAVLGLPAALHYVDERFRGVPAPSNCR